MTGCTVRNNTSKEGGGVNVARDHTSIFKAADTVFSGNESTEQGGGAIAAYAETTLDGCTLSGNKAYTSGCGIWAKTAITMTDCIVNKNVAENNSGGGIYSLSYLNLNGCYVSENTCAEWGGGIYLPDSTTLKRHIGVSSDSAAAV